MISYYELNKIPGRFERDFRGLGEGSHRSCLRGRGRQHATDRTTVGHIDHGHGGVEQRPGQDPPDRIQPGRTRGRFRGQGVETPQHRRRADYR